MSVKRIFLFVLDSFGIGEAPDSSLFGDEGANTLKSVSKSPYFNLKNLINLGFSHIDGVELPKNEILISQVARLQEKSMGKDTTIGHWEISGVVSTKPLPAFPDGFPEKFIKAFSEKIGKGILCNKVYSGTEVLKDYGNEHLKTGDLIVYTSADSVFQIAAHESAVSHDKLYEYCKIAREMLSGDLGVGRVIARPFEGEYPFKRTSHRHDFSLLPPQKTMLNTLSEKGYDVLSVGKINDIFAGSGITEFVYSENNEDGLRKAKAYAQKSFNGLCFINLVDFDMVYGHRRDADGYAKALSRFDAFLPEFINNINSDDVLIITADHGCDPCFKGTDHTREYVPFLMYGAKIQPQNIGTIQGFDYISKTILNLLECDEND